MLVHVDAVKEFYAKMTVIHLKKKDVVKSSVKGIGIEFDHERLATILGSGENRRRDDEVEAPEEAAEEDEEGNKAEFDWKAVIDEATVEGESGSDDQFYDAQVEQKDKEPLGVDPSGPTGRIPEAELLKFQAEFERKRANKFHNDLEKAKAENARLLALLHQAQTKPHS
ncbi:hypothetical protein Dimus_036765 [Dionaea muscipula]